MSIRVMLSSRHARALYKLAMAGARQAQVEPGFFTDDEADAAPHAIRRLIRAMEKHRVSPTSGGGDE